MSGYDHSDGRQQVAQRTLLPTVSLTGGGGGTGTGAGATD